MNASGALAYAVLVLGLYLKYFVVIAIQGLERRRSAVFRWPEDAATWRGQVLPEGPRVERAQAALRNAGESEPLFLAASGAWIALGAAPGTATLVCVGYALLRWAHALWLLVPRQPQRTHVFALSQLCLLGVVIDLVRLAWLAGAR
jgi:uncharacterized MAPEG superfamily protein